MKVGRIRSQQFVLDSWSVSNGGNQNHNKPLIDTLPINICWAEAEIEATDLAKLYLIGADDIKASFGSLCLEHVCFTDLINMTLDERRHGQRIDKLETAFSLGLELEPIIAIAFSGLEPYVIIDGNHRAAALARRGLIVGQTILLGLHSQMAEFVWFKKSFIH